MHNDECYRQKGYGIICLSADVEALIAPPLLEIEKLALRRLPETEAGPDLTKYKGTWPYRVRIAEIIACPEILFCDHKEDSPQSAQRTLRKKNRKWGFSTVFGISPFGANWTSSHEKSRHSQDHKDYGWLWLWSLRWDPRWLGRRGGRCHTRRATHRGEQRPGTWT